MYSLEGDDRDGRGLFSRKGRRSHFLATAFQVVVKFCFRGECCAAFAEQSLDSNKIDRYFFKTLVCVGDTFVVLVKCGIEAFRLIFYLVLVKLIYPFFVGFLVATIR